MAASGNVATIPFSTEQTADAVRRLLDARLLDIHQARRFAAARLDELGHNPVKVLGCEAPGWRQRTV